MDNLNQNTNSELLSLYMDGELDAAAESELLGALQNDSELNAELEQLQEIRNTIKKDEEAFTPPSDAKENVFATLGIGETAVTAGGASSTNSGFWVTAASVVSVSLITVALIFSLNENNNSNVEMQSANSNVRSERTYPLTSSTEKENRNITEKAENNSTINSGESESSVITNNNNNERRISITDNNEVQNNETTSNLELTENASSSKEVSLFTLNEASIESINSQNRLYNGFNPFDNVQNQSFTTPKMKTDFVNTVRMSFTYNTNNPTSFASLQYVWDPLIFNELKPLFSLQFTDQNVPVSLGAGLEWDIYYNSDFALFINSSAIVVGPNQTANATLGLKINDILNTNIPVIFGANMNKSLSENLWSPGIYIGTEIAY